MGEYYIYEYIRLDTNEPFYIGKGKGERWRHRSRSYNKYFDNIIKNIDVAVIILQDNLDEDTAYKYECWYIWHYRDILGYNLANFSDGGEGGVGGNNWAEKDTEEYKNRCNKISKTLKENKSVSGENNPMFGKKGYWSGRKRPQSFSEKMRGRSHENCIHTGKENGMSVQIEVYEPGGKLYKKFDTIADCMSHFAGNFNTTSRAIQRVIATDSGVYYHKYKKYQDLNGWVFKKVK